MCVELEHNKIALQTIISFCTWRGMKNGKGHMCVHCVQVAHPHIPPSWGLTGQSSAEGVWGVGAWLRVAVGPSLGTWSLIPQGPLSSC